MKDLFGSFKNFMYWTTLPKPQPCMHTLSEYQQLMYHICGCKETSRACRSDKRRVVLSQNLKWLLPEKYRIFKA
ncbi:hypothetical protein LguiA_008472 [Lonicera macranthoides]